jgi:hypothetical protein
LEAEAHVMRVDSSKGEDMSNSDNEVNWSAVIARSLAYLSLKNSRFADKSLLEQAQFLEKLGLPIEDRAAVVGSTPASLRELSRQAKAKKAKGRDGKVKPRTKGR